MSKRDDDKHEEAPKKLRHCKCGEVAAYTCVGCGEVVGHACKPQHEAAGHMVVVGVQS